MDGISERLQQKLERAFLEAKDAIIETVLAGWDRKTRSISVKSRRLPIVWRPVGVVAFRSGPRGT